MLKEEESKIVALKKAIIEGTESGIAANFNPQQHLAIKSQEKKWLNIILLT
ncbi:MAG TPA: type II toxin-antitoxin system ParD family antitoxin [Flavobacterium sp.]